MVVVACEVVERVVAVVTDFEEEDKGVDAPCVDLELELVLLLFWVDAVDDEEDGVVP